MEDKRALTLDELEAQTAVELPERDLMALINVFVPILISDLDVVVQVPIGVAANVCGVQVGVLANQEFGADEVACEAESTQIPRAFLP